MSTKTGFLAGSWNIRKLAAKLTLFTITATFVFGGFFTPLARAASVGDVVINEFLSDDVGTSAVEWIELKNTTSNGIDLNGWILKDITFPPGSSVPNGTGILEIISGTLAAGSVIVFDDLSCCLNNGGDSISLYDSDNVLIDNVTYGVVSGKTSDVQAPVGGQSATLISGHWIVTNNTTKNAANPGLVTNDENEFYAAVQEAINGTRDGGVITLHSSFATNAAIVVNKPLVINGGDHTVTFTGLETAAVDDALTITAPATINNLKVDSGLTTPTTWVGTYSVHVYNTTATLNNVTATKGNGGILVNGSNVTLIGVTTLSGNGFGGMEVSRSIPNNLPNSTLTITGTFANGTEAYGLPTLWLVNDQGSVTGANVPTTTSTTVKAGQTQYYIVAGNVKTSASVATLPELQAALANGEVSTINITANISATESVVVSRAVTINGGGNALSFTGLETAAVDDGLNIQAPATVNDLVVDAGLTTPTTWVGTYAVHVYNTTATLNNVTATKGNGGILVNGSNVTLTGVTTLSGNGFGGIEVSKGAQIGLPNSSLTVTGSLVNSTEAYGLPTVWVINGQGSVVGGPVTTNTTKNPAQTQYYLIPANATDPDIIAPTLNITGFTADGIDMPAVGSSSTLTTNNDPAKEYLLNFKAGSAATENLKNEMFGLTLAPTVGQTAALQAYYLSKPEAYRTYLDAAAAGTEPFVYIKGNGDTSVSLVDGARYFLGHVETPMAVPGDFPVGSYTVTGSIKDLSNNSRTVTFTLIVEREGVADTTPPAISFSHERYIASAPFTLDATVTDASGIASYLWEWPDKISFTPNNTEDTLISSTEDGSYWIRLNATDNAGNSAHGDVQVIWDTTTPVITLNGLAVEFVMKDGVYVDAGAVAKDAGFSDVPLTASSSVNTAVVGEYILTYNYTDIGGHAAAQVTRRVVVGEPSVPSSDWVWLYDGVVLDDDTDEVVVGSDELTEPEINVAADKTDATINFSYHMSDDVVTVPMDILVNSTVGGKSILTVFPEGMSITGPDGWDGVITLPKSATASGDAPAGFSLAGHVFELGLATETLQFDQSITITLTGVTGPVGYKAAGSSTWVVVAGCDGSYSSPTLPIAMEECSATNGVDTVILTKHLTTFSSLTAIVTGGSGGGGFGGGPVAPVNNGQVLGQSTLRANGSLIIHNGTIYMIMDGLKRGFRNFQEFMSYGFSVSDVDTANIDDMNLPDGQILKAKDGTLVLDLTDGRTVYIISNGQKRAFPSAQVFHNLGYSFRDLARIDLTDYENGAVVVMGSHVDGTLVISGRTVYLIQNGQRMPISSIDVFNKHRFQVRNIVKANAQDMALSQGAFLD